MPLRVAAEPTHEADYLIFYASRDENGQMWCPDCRNVEHIIASAFEPEDAPDAVIVYVGARAEWKAVDNRFRQAPWNVTSIPTIVHFDKQQEAGRLVEDEILESAKFALFLKQSY